MVIDYKMKLEPGKRTHEIQHDWYGKREISLHGCYIVAQIGENEKSCNVFDLWSEDTKQDAFFTQSALDVCFMRLERAFPGFSVCFLVCVQFIFTACYIHTVSLT